MYIFVDTGRGGNTLASMGAIISMLNGITEEMNVVFVMHIVYKISSGNTSLSGSFLRLASIVNAYKNKTAGSGYGATWDFTNAHGKPIAIFGGHMHQDLDMTYNDENNPSGVPVIVTDTDSYRNHANTAGTTDSQCFDVVTIDYMAKTIKCVRIGRGNDRTFTFE